MTGLRVPLPGWMLGGWSFQALVTLWPRVKSGRPPAFVREAFFFGTQLVHLCMISGHFPSSVAGAESS